MVARIIGVGQHLAGDDAVGLAILERVRTAGVPQDVEILEVAEPSALVPLLQTTGSVVILDAVVGEGPPGEVVDVDGGEMDGAAHRSLPTHGLNVVRAIALAGILWGQDRAPSVRIVGVRISAPVRGTCGLSARVAAAVDHAARVALARATLSRTR